MSVRDIMIKGHFLVTLVVSTGQTHNFGKLRPAIPWSPMYRLLIPHIKHSVRESMIKSHWAPDRCPTHGPAIFDCRHFQYISVA